ncbi:MULTISPECIES: PilZ domain-containing protein [unclassified Massilia]|uniref:PilZ domain-containing protein n=1 Tax=unclassified Massilia TaxID=2609279 RepID=UPI0009E6E757|nr:MULTISPECIES: PilZ domain-containing protein [unclassified Massilia]
MTDQRQSARKIVKVKAVIAMEGQAPMPGRTSDIGSNGVSIAVAHPLQVGQTGQVGFDLLVEGKLASIMARAKVIYCIFSGGEFKAGFQFLNLDLSAMAQLSRFLR